MGNQVIAMNINNQAPSTITDGSNLEFKHFHVAHAVILCLQLIDKAHFRRRKSVLSIRVTITEM